MENLKTTNRSNFPRTFIDIFQLGKNFIAQLTIYNTGSRFFSRGPRQKKCLQKNQKYLFLRFFVFVKTNFLKNIFWTKITSSSNFFSFNHKLTGWIHAQKDFDKYLWFLGLTFWVVKNCKFFVLTWPST